ncbi:D-alanyl-D-alanine carboxypeptidase [Streptomyces sp. cmx-4-9]|uniref:D-alanyl-D-alanine carboxypeptidase n=1 Tax=Streptomyces sp. cmx-4-9 TaxID=2790941 RepID=UPI003980FDC3
MKAVAVAGGSPDTPESPETAESAETEGTEVPATETGAQDTAADPGGPGVPQAAETAETTGTPAGNACEDAPGQEDDLEETDAGTRAASSAEDEPAEEGPEEVTAAGGEAEDEDEDEDEVGPAAEPVTEPHPEAEDAPGRDSGPDSQEAAQADPDAKQKPHTDPEPDPDTGTDTKSDAEREADGDGGDTASEADTDAEANPQPEADVDPDPQPDPDPDPEADADPDPEPDPDADAEADADAEQKPHTDPDPDAERDPRTDPEPHTDAGTDTDTDTKSDAEREADGDGRDAASEADPEPNPQPEADPDPEPGAGAGDAAIADRGTDSAQPVGGAGSASVGGGVRRVPSWARGGAGDAERTSTFVALKELDAPAGKTPRATPDPAAPSPGPTPTPARTPATAPAPAPARASVVERTREAPLPPLELLAELTNTAPPPETPRRTAVRRVKIWAPLLLLLAGGVTGAQLLRPLPAPQLVAAEQTHTLDGQFSVPWPGEGQGAVRVPGSGTIGTFGEQKPVPTASVAKVMTAYVILKGHPLRKNEAGPQIEVDAKTVADGNAEHESRVEGLVAGTKFSQQDMLKMLMIPSGNNVARLLARWDSGTDSEAAFVAKMNAAAAELGMHATTYTDPSGLDAGTVSTADDQLKLAEAVMKDEAFRAVVALPSADIKGLSKALINNNDLLTVNGLSIRGIKTGSSTPAGGALMWAAYKSVGDETPLILGTLMDQHADGPDLNGENSLLLVKANSKKIIEAVRQALTSAPVVRKGQTVGHVDDGLGGRTPLVAARDLNVIGVPGQQLTLTLKPGASAAPHSAKAGTEVGVLTAGDGEGAKSVPVAVGTELSEPSFGARISRLG